MSKLSINCQLFNGTDLDFKNGSLRLPFILPETVLSSFLDKTLDNVFKLVGIEAYQEDFIVYNARSFSPQNGSYKFYTLIEFTDKESIEINKLKAKKIYDLYVSKGYDSDYVENLVSNLSFQRTQNI